jgi:hypothetical protein
VRSFRGLANDEDFKGISCSGDFSLWILSRFYGILLVQAKESKIEKNEKILQHLFT